MRVVYVVSKGTKQENQNPLRSKDKQLEKRIKTF
nr:MAG TPA: hypothetical protein [Caudoviricetes sp.]